MSKGKHARLSVAGMIVGAHHQNGVAEKRIRYITEQARKMLIHASSRWPSTITTELWPYAYRQAQEVYNSLPRDIDGNSSIEIFSGCNVAPQLSNFHTFG